MYSKLALPASILIATIIGAGVFSLPFVFEAAGLLTGLFYLVLFALVFIFMDLLYADLIVRTPGEHRFAGYSKIYFGNKGFWAAIFTGLFRTLFVLTIYLILAPSFSQLFIPGDSLTHLLVFWILGSFTVLLGIKRIATIEFFITGGMMLIIVLIFILGAPNFIQFGDNWLPFDLSKFVAVGPILFALAGRAAVPEIVNYFRITKTPLSFLKKPIMIGTILSAIAYFLFVVGIMGLSPVISEDAVSGLVGGVPTSFLVAIGVLGLFSLMGSYIAIGLNARRMFHYDLLFPGWLSKLIVIFAPPILYFVGFQNFLVLVSYLGGIFMPIEGIFLLFMWLKARKQAVTPPILVNKFIVKSIPILLLIFLTVLIYVIIN